MTTTLTTANATSDASTPGHRLRRWRRPLAITTTGVTAAIALLWPGMANAYLVTVAATALVFAILAMSTQLLTGIAGLPSMGQTAYYGIGAYTAALLGHAGHTIAAAQLAAAVLASALAGAVTAPLVLRTRGIAFLMATLALQALAATAAAQWRPVTGGSEGMRTPPITLWPGGPDLTAPAYLYWYALAVTALLAAGVAVLMRSRFVLILRGIGGNETRMDALGHPVARELTGAYVIAAALAGAAGALLVAVNQYLSPGDIGFDIASLALLAAAIGGTSMTGAAFGAVAIIAVRDGLGVDSGGLSPLLLGLLLITAAYSRALRARAHHGRGPS